MKTYIKIVAFSAAALNLHAQDKPNILWLTYEDTSPEFIGCYGNSQAKTPNIDNLAKSGVRFSSAYSTSAVSSPSRYCLITGTHANQMGTGNHRSRYRIPSEIKGFPYYLKQAGYYTSNNVKTDYNVANAQAFTKEAWDESSNKAGWWNRKAGQPFFAVYNSIASHQARTMTHSWEKYEEWVLSKLPLSQMVNDSNLLIPKFYRDSPEMQKNMSRVYNSIALMDVEFGEWLNRLEKEGLRDSTIIFCFSDHGQGITRSKGSATTTGYQVPFIVWIPPMYQHLSPWGSGVITDELVSFEDLAPTMLHLAGIPVPEYMKGRIFMGKNPTQKKEYVFSGLDRTDESSELSRTVIDGKYQYTRVFMPFQPFVRWNMYYDMSDLQKNIRNDYEKGLLNEIQSEMFKPRVAEYLYDTQTDNWGVKNLINDPTYQDIAEEMRNALFDNIIQTKDPHFMTEYTFIQEDKMPFELAKDPVSYPIKEILKVASLAGMGKNVLSDQLDFLKNENKYIRYWAAVGLFSQEKISKRDLKIVEKASKKETFPPAKNTLISILFKQNSKKYTQDAKKLILENDPELLRISLNLLITLDKKHQQIILPEIQKRLEFNEKNNVKEMNYCNEYFRLFKHNVEGYPINID